MTARYALYAVPPREHPLWAHLCQWLGRDPQTGRDLAPELPPWLSHETWLEWTKSARHYGPHATLKAPLALAVGRTPAAFDAAIRAFGLEIQTLPPVPLVLRELDGFLALVPPHRIAPVMRLADLATVRFDRFRAEQTPESLAERRKAGLTRAQEAHLVRWGYPYVFDCFRFHITLTARLPDGERAMLKPWLADYFAPALQNPVPLDLALFSQPDRLHPFSLDRRYKIGG